MFLINIIMINAETNYSTDLSKQLGLNKYTIYQKIRKNKFPKGVKLNGRRLFKTTEIEEYLQSLNIQSKVTV